MNYLKRPSLIIVALERIAFLEYYLRCCWHHVVVYEFTTYSYSKVTQYLAAAICEYGTVQGAVTKPRYAARW